MSNVRRVYVEKKPAFAVKAKELKHEIKHYLGISTVTAVRELIRYDVENISDEVFEKACKTVFAEPPVDELYLEKFDVAEGARVFSVEFLPGQFDQRADSAVQCVQFLDENAAPIIRSATTYVIEGTVTDAEFEAIKHHCINPVDSRETGLEKPETLVTVFPDPEDVKIFDGFKDMAEADLKELYASLNLAMTFKDFQHIQKYFKNEEKRDPSMTEIRVLDTYWSDHCRHTTFSTELTSVKFDEGDYKAPIEKTYEEYLDAHKNMYKDRDDKFVCLTEDLVGPYELHDFYLYYMLRAGFTPDKIYRLACLTFDGIYDKETILKWLKTFYRRFFAQQFKRSCLPDGPKVGSVALSPRGDLRMPSDASARIWQDVLEKIEI